jgi:2-polyprenyl-6-methoxyphenol hydroxylase-like FAD-dependent oxidoreductase
MLARLLHLHDISCTIFEGETSVDYRSQGGTLDLRTKTGLAAIREAGLWDQFTSHARYDGESMLVTDKHLTTWLRRSAGKADQKSRPGAAPEIDRRDLRKMLLDSLPNGSIRWGMKLARVQETGAGHELCFASGEVERGYDLIVGCDGAFSKTRSLLTSEKPFYTNLAGWTMQIPNAKTTAPEVYKFVNRGSVFAYSDGNSMSIQQLSSGNIWVSTYGHHPEQPAPTADSEPTDMATLKKSLAAEFHDWAPELVNAFSEGQDPVWRQLYMLPVGFTWPHRKGVTLLGDAAHLMTPFGGIGVNTAFYDALLLSRQILEFANSEQIGDLDGYIIKYEQDMFEHAHKAQKLTEAVMKAMLFTPGAPRTSIEAWALTHAKADLPTWAHPFLTAAVYIGFWVYKLFV